MRHHQATRMQQLLQHVRAAYPEISPAGPECVINVEPLVVREVLVDLAQANTQTHPRIRYACDRRFGADADHLPTIKLLLPPNQT